MGTAARSSQRVVVGLLVAGLLVAGTVAVWRWRTVPAYVGTARPVTLQWALHFDAADRATFTSDGGGSVALRRIGPGEFTRLSCAIR